MNVLPFPEQGSDEWLLQRVGRATASRIDDVAAQTKSGGWGASRARYMAELLTERFSGVPYPQYVTQAMKWGTERQAEAMRAYAFRCDTPVKPVGYTPHPRIKMSGASPDGLVGKKGLVETKCPETHTHLATIKDNKIDRGYMYQVQWQLACTGRDWCDWVSYDPRLIEELQYYEMRIHRDKKMIESLESIVAQFLQELDAEVAWFAKERGAKPKVAA